MGGALDGELVIAAAKRQLTMKEKKPLPEWAAVSSFEWAVASETEGALGERADVG